MVYLISTYPSQNFTGMWEYDLMGAKHISLYTSQ